MSEIESETVPVGCTDEIDGSWESHFSGIWAPVSRGCYGRRACDAFVDLSLAEGRVRRPKYELLNAANCPPRTPVEAGWQSRCHGRWIPCSPSTHGTNAHAWYPQAIAGGDALRRPKLRIDRTYARVESTFAAIEAKTITVTPEMESRMREVLGIPRATTRLERIAAGIEKEPDPRRHGRWDALATWEEGAALFHARYADAPPYPISWAEPRFESAEAEAAWIAEQVERKAAFDRSLTNTFSIQVMHADEVDL